MSNRKIALYLIAIVLSMTALSFASVPLYRLFCQVTGFAGTTLQAKAAPDEMLEREITVNFNTDLDKSLPWKFAPEQPKITVKVGEEVLVFFEVQNLSDTLTFGTSVFNVTPHKVGEYFMKTECFCYEEQAVEPKQVVKMPVSFFIDPEIMDDENLDDVTNITLSYTFFKVKK